MDFPLKELPLKHSDILVIFHLMAQYQPYTLPPYFREFSVKSTLQLAPITPHCLPAFSHTHSFLSSLCGYQTVSTFLFARGNKH